MALLSLGLLVLYVATSQCQIDVESLENATLLLAKTFQEIRNQVLGVDVLAVRIAWNNACRETNECSAVYMCLLCVCVCVCVCMCVCMCACVFFITKTYNVATSGKSVACLCAGTLCDLAVLISEDVKHCNSNGDFWGIRRQ